MCIYVLLVLTVVGFGDEDRVAAAVAWWLGGWEAATSMFSGAYP